MAIDAHANDQLGVFGFPEVDTRQRVFVSQVHIDVCVQWSLRAAPGGVFGAMAPTAVGTGQLINRVLERVQRSVFVKTHLLGIEDGFDVGSTTSIRKFHKPEICGQRGSGQHRRLRRRRCCLRSWGRSAKQNKDT